MALTLYFCELELGKVTILHDECDFPWMVGTLERRESGNSLECQQLEDYIEHEIGRSAAMDENPELEDESEFEEFVLEDGWRIHDEDGETQSVYVAFHPAGRIGWRFA